MEIGVLRICGYISDRVAELEKLIFGRLAVGVFFSWFSFPQEEMFGSALEDATKAIKLDPKYLKVKLFIYFL